jgi:hypothetical protein
VLDTNVGKLLIDDALPEDLRQDNYRLDKAGTHELMRGLAEKHPEQYRDVLKKLSDIGRDTIYTSGTSVNLSGLKSSEAKDAVLGEARQKIQQIIANDKVPDAEKEKFIVDTLLPLGPKLQDALFEEAKKENNPYYLQLISGGRGKKSDYNSLRGADLLASDPAGNIIPIPILHSYSEGLDPVEYWAGMYGQRKGMIGVKMATADAGYLTKRLTNASHRTVVTSEQPEPTRVLTGLPVSPKDKDSVGAVLAKSEGPYPAGTILTDKMLKDLDARKVDEIVVHSPVAEASEDGGISRLAAGKRDRFGLSHIGDNVGIPAAQSIGEKLSQGALGCLAEGTLVRMADFSVKPIEQIQLGQWVLGANTTGQTFPVQVTHTFDQGYQPCHSTVFKTGKRPVKELISTACHKVLVTTHFSGHSEEYLNNKPRILPIGKRNRDMRCVVPIGFSSLLPMQHEPAAYLIGMLLGDGCYTESVKGVFLSCADQLMIENVSKYLEPFNLKLAHTHVYNYRLSSIVEAKHAHAAGSGHFVTGEVVNPARRILDRYGMGHKYAHEKTLPSEVDSWDNQSIADLLAGLIDTDGCVMERRLGAITSATISFSSSSLEMLEKVRFLFEMRFGIYGAATSVRLPGSAGTFYSKHAQYTFSISDAESVGRFVANIHLKGIKAQRLLQYHNPHQTKCTAAGRMRRVSQTPVGMRHVFDIEVSSPDHLFVLANGLIVSNSKHGGGVAKAGIDKSGIDVINRMIEGPENFPESGPLAREAGVVRSIEDAPQGGRFITIGQTKHYAGQDLTPTVKVGDTVEEGDELTDGLPHPSELIRYKGIGEARRQYLKHFGQVLKDSGAPTHRRNLEAVVSGLINHAVVTDPDGIGDHVPDDVVAFNQLVHNYKPRPDAKLMAPHAAVGRYLEEPALHHTVGTKLTKRVASHLEKHGIRDVYTHEEPPGFEPYMQRAITHGHSDPDWESGLGGFYTSSGFEHNLARGATSTPNSTSFLPALALGTDFGKHLKQTGHYGPGPE